ncbi:zinc finger protein 200 isoform X1 [Notamacropus eugenii]|uniref:zinc finger protein 200 isoform X1 n=1 Tax=Notamacropus eugenii TaxID=9315 RepID=UPI003B66F2EB
MAAEAVLTPPKQAGSLILKLVPGPKMGQDALQESAVPPKTIHQLVLEHFFTFLPEKNQSQNHKTGKEDTIILVKDVTSTLQNRAHPASWVTIFPKDRRVHKREVGPQTFPSELQEPLVFEDLNVYHSQEEYVGLDLAQRSPFSRNHGEEDVGDMVLEVDCSENKEDDHQPENPEDVEHHEMSSGYCERDGSQIFKQAKDYEKRPESHEEKRLNTSIPQEKRFKSLLITVENDAPLEDLSKYVDMSILALSQNRRTRRFYTCPQCGKHFTESSYLISHQRTHTGEKPYDCIHCGKSFNHKTNLNKHERIHTGEKPYTCSQCGKNFRQNSHRSRHEVIHVKEKLLKCQECGKSFLGDEEFLLHQETHEEERPYRCSRCGRRFSRQSNCTRHEKAHFIPKPQKQVLSS